ncbi:hypothetical protein HZS_5258 [Henneguya salminicola]|nr:hypothetical protein HZS_5258 [Henneguya salminicola]
MNWEIDYDQQFHIFSEDEIIRGNIKINTENIKKFRSINVEIIGGIYMKDENEIDPCILLLLQITLL